LIVLDTSGLLAALAADQRHHAACRRALDGDPGPFLLSPFVLAETDYLIGRAGRLADQSAFLEEVERGVYRLAPFDAADVALARRVMARYEDLRIGLTDASLVVLAARHRTRRLLTLDERHFRTVRALDGEPFELLPADA
jgi:predicted nucleic acid-binding protein